MNTTGHCDDCGDDSNALGEFDDYCDTEIRFHAAPPGRWRLHVHCKGFYRSRQLFSVALRFVSPRSDISWSDYLTLEHVRRFDIESAMFARQEKDYCELHGANSESRLKLSWRGSVIGTSEEASAILDIRCRWFQSHPTLWDIGLDGGADFTIRGLVCRPEFEELATFCQRLLRPRKV